MLTERQLHVTVISDVATRTTFEIGDPTGMSASSEPQQIISGPFKKKSAAVENLWVTSDMVSPKIIIQSKICSNTDEEIGY